MQTESKKLLLEARGIHKQFYYPKPISILRGVSLNVSQGQSVAIVGRSGEGKSTLLQILGTLEQPCEGILKIANQKVTEFNKTSIRNRSIGFVFQSFHLLEDYTALENVLMPARIGRHSTKKGSPAEQKAWHLLEKVGLADRAHYHTKLLSGGEKQRVALARAMCNDPDLIMADEPTGNLDRETSYLIHQMLIDFAKDPRKGLVVVTHDKELAALCDTQYELINGVLVSKDGIG